MDIALSSFVEDYNRLLGRSRLTQVPPARVEDVVERLSTLDPLPAANLLRWNGLEGPVRSVLAGPGLELLQALRFLFVIHGVPRHDMGRGIFWDDLGWYRTRQGLPFTLCDVAEAFRTLGLDAESIGRELARPRFGGRVSLPSDMVWPYFESRLELLIESFRLGEATWRQLAYQIVRCFPRVPERLDPLLWEVALGSGKTERPMAQACLEGVPDLDERLVAALQDRGQDARREAALWLGRRRVTAAVEPLRKALAKEKLEPVKGAMLEALEALGVPPGELLDVRKLEVEASRLKRPIEWGPWEDESPLVRWMIAQSHRSNDPQPGAVVRYLLRMTPNRVALANRILVAWIAQDTVPKHSEARILEVSRQSAAHLRSIYPGLTDEQIAARNAQAMRLECQGSATADKGVLAVAAGGDATTVEMVRHYLNKWYGNRAAQCRALVQMLAAMDEPAAVQLLLSVSRKFRTAGIQKEAADQVRLLAERRGWTVDDLADRTIPTAGFDSGYEQVLEDGAVLRLDDHAEVSGTAPEAVRRCRKEVKAILQAQMARLFEAMLTQRAWSFSDWETYLNRHPVVGSLCRRVVWSSGEVTFRPLEDGSLCDAESEPVDLASDVSIRMAHSLTTNAGLGWVRHFLENAIPPLFPQFVRPAWTLKNQEQTALEDFQGHLVKAFALRAKALSLGYSRGPAQDGGWLCWYRRSFPSIDIEVRLEFSGNQMPEQDRLVALERLSYWRGERPLPLGEVPAVMLSEGWNDLKDVAAEGPGFAPDWESKIGR